MLTSDFESTVVPKAVAKNELVFKVSGNIFIMVCRTVPIFLLKQRARLGGPSRYLEHVRTVKSPPQQPDDFGQLNNRPRVFRVTNSEKCTYNHISFSTRQKEKNNTAFPSKRWSLQKSTRTGMYIFCIWRWLFHQRGVGKKIWFFRPPMMSFAFLDMIFGGKGLQIDTYKPPKCIWSYHTHVVNTSWPKWSKRSKFTFSSDFDVKNSIKSS